MSDRDVDLTITATDDASKIVGKVADAIDELPDTATVDVDADTTGAGRAIDKFATDVAGLTEQSKELRIDFREKVIESKIKRLLRELERIDDPVELDVKSAELETARDDLDDLRRFAGKDITAKIDVDDSDLDETETKLDKLGTAAGEIGGPLGSSFDVLSGAGGPLAAVTGIGAAIGAAAAKTLELTQNITTVATAFDTTNETASRLVGVFQDFGFEAGDLADIGLQVAGVLADDAELAGKLGLSIDQAKNPAEALTAAIDSWDFLTAQERSAAFGEEGVRQIAAIVASGEDIDDLLAGISDTRVFTDAEIAKAQEMADTMRDLKAGIDSLIASVGGDLLEAFANVKEILADIGDLPVIDDIGDALGADNTDKLWDGLKKGGLGAFNDLYDKAAGTDIAGAIAPDLATVEAATVDADAAADAYATHLADVAAEATAAATAVLAQADAALTAAGAARTVADANIAATAETDAWNVALFNNTAALADTSTGSADYNALLASTTTAATSAADAIVAQAQATAQSNGETLSASSATSTWNQAMIGAARQASGPLQSAIVDYIATVNGIPPEKVSDIVADTDYESVAAAGTALDNVSETRDAQVKAEAETAAAQAELDALDNQRDVDIRANIVQGYGWDRWAQLLNRRSVSVAGNVTGVSAGVGAPSTRDAGGDTFTASSMGTSRRRGPTTTTNNVTVNLPAAAEARDIVRVLDRWQRVNGRQR